MSATSKLPAIDVHGHFGQYVRPEMHELLQRFMSGDASTVVARAKAAHIRYTVASPLRALLPRGQANAVAGNEEARVAVRQTEGLLQWVVLDPRQPASFEQVREMLQDRKCVGIKIHPEEHCYPIAEYGRAIFELAAELKTVILTHSGEQNSLPADFVPFANEFPEATLILAHLGCGFIGQVHFPDLQVRAIQASRHGNIYTDTSSAQSLMPGLIEWAVSEVGAERLLFGTDTPLYFAASQRARIDNADLRDEQKRMILWDNAQQILRIPSDMTVNEKCIPC